MVCHRRKVLAGLIPGATSISPSKKSRKAGSKNTTKCKRALEKQQQQQQQQQQEEEEAEEAEEAEVKAVIVKEETPELETIMVASVNPSLLEKSLLAQEKEKAVGSRPRGSTEEVSDSNIALSNISTPSSSFSSEVRTPSPAPAAATASSWPLTKEEDPTLSVADFI